MDAGGRAAIGADHSAVTFCSYILPKFPVRLFFSDRVCGHRATSHCNGTGQLIVSISVGKKQSVPSVEVSAYWAEKSFVMRLLFFLDVVLRKSTIIRCAVCEMCKELLRVHLGLCQLAALNCFTSPFMSVIHCTENSELALECRYSISFRINLFLLYSL